jgi:hypothetical protein
MQPTRNEPMNASNVDATQKGEVNEQHQNSAKNVVQRNPVVFSTTHQTPQTSTQLKVVNVHNGDNHELIQPFDEVVYVRQPWQSTTLGYYLPRRGTPTLIITSISFQNQPPNTNINLVPTNLEMEQLHLLNKLEHLHHINQKPSNQSVSIPNLEPIEPRARPTIL